jgi:hypothetical protein
MGGKSMAFFVYADIDTRPVNYKKTGVIAPPGGH